MEYFSIKIQVCETKEVTHISGYLPTLQNQIHAYHSIHGTTVMHTHTHLSTGMKTTSNTGYPCTYGGSSMKKKRRGVKVGNAMLSSPFCCVSSGSETPQPLHRTNIFIFFQHILLVYSSGAHCPLSEIFLMYCTFQEVRLFLQTIKPCSTNNKLQNLLTSSHLLAFDGKHVIQYSLLRCHTKHFSRQVPLLHRNMLLKTVILICTSISHFIHRSNDMKITLIMNNLHKCPAVQQVNKSSECVYQGPNNSVFVF